MKSAEIAKIAGVSRSTVSRVINNYPNVPEETRQKVLAVIKEYNYVPQASARMLVGKKSRIIALIIVDTKLDDHGNKVTSSSYFSEFTNTLIDCTNKLGYNILVSIVDKESSYKNIDELFYSKTVAGGIFIGEKNNDTHIMKLIEEGYPIAVVGQSLTKDSIFNKSIVVNADNYGGAYAAVKYLLERGHRKIVHISGDMGQLSSIERLEGYKNALLDFNIPFKKSYIIKGNYTEESGYKGTLKLLSKSTPDAIFSANDNMAIGAIRAIEKVNLKVPDDISVIGFDNIEPSSYMKPSLTTVSLSSAKMAVTAAHSLIKFIEDPKYVPEKFNISVELLERASCKSLIE